MLLCDVSVGCCCGMLLWYAAVGCCMWDDAVGCSCRMLLLWMLLWIDVGMHVAMSSAIYAFVDAAI